MKSRTFYFLLLSVAVLEAGCRGPQGDPGPRGAAGTQGPRGNANVQSFVYTVNPQDWFEVGTFGLAGHGYNINLDVPEITQSVNDFGMVAVYYRTNSGAPWTALPEVFPDQDFTRHLLFNTTVGRITLEVYESNFKTARPGVSIFYKTVIVDGLSGKVDFDWRDYNAVAAAFNLQD